MTAAHGLTGARAVARGAAFLASFGASGALIGAALQRVAGNRMAPWIVGRAAGVCAYLLLTGLVLLGLLLSHPWRGRVRRPSSTSRMRAHVALALFTFGFTALHVIVLATDRWAGVGWYGAVVPMGASYRPAAVTLGIVGVWVALLVGASAAAAGRLPRRLWWPLHKIAAVAFVLVWLHGVLAGGDTAALRTVYVVSGALMVLLAGSRYLSRTPRAPLDASRL